MVGPESPCGLANSFLSFACTAAVPSSSLVTISGQRLAAMHYIRDSLLVAESQSRFILEDPGGISHLLLRLVVQRAKETQHANHVSSLFVL